LAVTLRALGDQEGARALEEKVLEVFSRTLRDDHPALQEARRNVALDRTRDGEDAEQLTLAVIRSSIHVLEEPEQDRAPREVEALAAAQEANLSYALSYARYVQKEELTQLVIQAVETVRAAAVARRRLLNLVAITPDAERRLDELRGELERMDRVVRRDL